MIDRDRTFHRLMAATRKKKAEDRHAVSGRFCWGKGNGQWLYKTRQIASGSNPPEGWKE